MIKNNKKSFFQINQFFLLLLLSIILSSISVYLILKTENEKNEKIEQFYNEMEKEKKKVLLLNEKLFNIIYMFCYEYISKEKAENLIEDLLKNTKKIYLKLECNNEEITIEKDCNFLNEQCKLKSLGSFYYTLDFCFC